jgi:Right handed beta helix region
MLVMLSMYAYAATNVYYVSSSAGNDNNSGISATAPWQTLAKINAISFAAGDRILLARGDVWHESLVPLTSGSTGVPIVFDAYGSGAAPEITGYKALSGWTTAGTNQWKAPLSASAMNYVLFGTIWGAKQSSQAAVLHDRDFYLNGGMLYVYAPSDPTTYYGTVAAMVVTNTPLISVSGKSWLTFQHIKLTWFDQYGVSVSGASDHLVFANMEADGMIPAGTYPIGFYVNAANPGDINFYNDSAHLNYNGFRVDGTASATIRLTNCAAYANRESGVTDATGGHVTYSYCHFYANGTGGIESNNVSGGVAGDGNVAPDTAPNVESFARYPARLSFTVDDVGLYAGSDTFVDGLIPVFNARGLKMNAAIVTGATGTSYSTADVANWVAGGHEVDSHSWSHQYFTDPDYLRTHSLFNSTNPTPATAFSLRYVGTGTAATATISGGVLSTSVSGGPGGQNLNLNLATAPYDTLGGLTAYISSTYPGVYSVIPWTTPLMRIAAHSTTLANFSGQDIKTTAYELQFDPKQAVTGLMADEATQSRNWLQGHIAGLTNVKVYVYPDGVTDPTFEAAVAAAGYEGARGTLSMCVSGAAPCAGSNGFVSYATGVNAQNITSLTPLAWTNYTNLTRPQLDAKVAALIFKMRVWGYPVGLFVHASDYADWGTAAMKTGWLLDAIAAHGGSVSRTDELIEAVLAMQRINGTSKYVTEAEAALNVRPTAAGPGIGNGTNQGTTYGRDLLGVLRPVSASWDIGAYQALWTKHGAGSGAGHFTMGGGNGVVLGENAYCGTGDVALFGTDPISPSVILPQQCIYTAMSGTPSPGAVHTVASNCSDLQTQINNAAAGDTIVIPASATCTGQYTFPAKTGADSNHWITVQTSALSDQNFPAEGTQATPCNIGLAHIDGYPDYACPVPAKRMPTLTISTNNQTPLTVTGKFYRFIGLEVTKNYGVSEGGQLVLLQYSDHVILDRMQIHGDNWDLHTPQYDTHVGIQTRGTSQAIINSWVYDIDWNAADGYAIGGGMGLQLDEGPIKIYNNVLAGSSETWLFGGGGVRPENWPHDYEIRRNLSLKPLKWMTAFNGRQYLQYPNIKNLGEYKHGHRILYEDNVFINNWEGQADQYGYALVVIPKNQSAWNQNLFVNTHTGVDGVHTITCAKDAAGTPCDPGTGPFGNYIVSMSRSQDVITLNGATNNAWPRNSAGGKVVLQGIQSQVVNGVDLASFNGEQTLGCLPNGGTCTSGFYHPNVMYIVAPGPDFPLTTLPANTGLAQDYTASTCATPNHCVFSAPIVNYIGTKFASIIDTEHATSVENLGEQTGVGQRSCHPGIAPTAQIQDMTIRYNYIGHSENIGINMVNAPDTCLDMALGVSKFSIHDNLADDIQAVAWTTMPTSAHGGTGPVVENGSSRVVSPHDITIAHNTWAGLRGYVNNIAAQGAAEIADNFNISHNATTVQRVANVVTINFAKVTGTASQYNSAVVAGFTGANADLNGTWTLSANNDTSITFTETGSHADIAPGTSAAGVTVTNWPPSYYANYVMRDNVFAGPMRATDSSQVNLKASLAAAFASNLCDVAGTGACTWVYKNNVYATAPYAGYATPSAGYLASIAAITTNPDHAPTCTVTVGCAVTDLSGVFTSWGGGLGDTRANDYRVTANYKNAGTDGKDLGANIERINAVKVAVLPHFTFNPLTIATSTLTPCTHGVYCEQQLTISSGASGPNGFVMWHLISGTLPTGMSLSTFDNNLATDGKVNGAFKNGPTGSAGWISGTPTQTGSFPLTFQAEDAAHQKASVNLTISVN